MSDPYGGKYRTAGDPYLGADGSSLSQAPGPTQTQYYQAFGEEAPIVFAEQANQSLLAVGRALLTSDGVIGVDVARAQLQQHGYTGTSDLQSIASAYNLLKTPPPATPAPAGSTRAATTTTGLGGIPTPVLIGGGVLLLLLLGGRGRLL